MGKTVSKPIQFALDCILWKNKDLEQKLLCSSNRYKKVNKFIKTCKNTALNNTGCKTFHKLGKFLMLQIT